MTRAVNAFAVGTGLSDDNEATVVDGMMSTRRGAWPLLPGVGTVGEWTRIVPDTLGIRILYEFLNNSSHINQDSIQTFLTQ